MVGKIFKVLEVEHTPFVLVPRRGGASRVFNKAHRVSQAMAGVGEKPTLYSVLRISDGSMSRNIP